jgi:hypothetical protein
MKNKIEHLWSVLCATTMVDRETNSLSLMNLVDQLNIDKELQSIKKLPINIPINFEMVSLFQRLDKWEEKELEIDSVIELLDPQGKLLTHFDFKINFPKGAKRLRYRLKISSVMMTTEGQYQLILKIKDGNLLREVTKLPLDIKFQNSI